MDFNISWGILFVAVRYENLLVRIRVAQIALCLGRDAEGSHLAPIPGSPYLPPLCTPPMAGFGVLESSDECEDNILWRRGHCDGSEFPSGY